jgi:archaellum component FlaD/FlaE
MSEVISKITAFQFVNQNLDCSKFKRNLDYIKYLIKIGWISPSLLRNFQVYSRYDYYQMQGFNFRDSVLCVSMDLDICERQVRRIIKNMEAEV